MTDETAVTLGEVFRALGKLEEIVSNGFCAASGPNACCQREVPSRIASGR